jgi:hypothetical protein
MDTRLMTGIHRRSHQPDASDPHRRSSNSELQLRQPGVHTALLDQFSVPAFFNHPALVQHQNAVCLRFGLRALQGGCVYGRLKSSGYTAAALLEFQLSHTT